ncbi:MAG: ribonuclease P protein component [Acholeplasmataceae bacterium]|jgi:ribonuclease P protein component|nr:ribonuclease P protein component [Acholeplasmataceae bacterium]
MKKRYRIKKSSEIDAIFKKKNIKGDSCFAIYQAEDLNATHFRFALSIGRKYGNAVERNLAKRRLRMIVHELSHQFIKNKLFVIVIKPTAKKLTFQEMKEKITSILEKSKLMEITNE